MAQAPKRLRLTTDYQLRFHIDVPVDTWYEILKWCQPCDVCRIACVCKALNEVCIDDSLWMFFVKKKFRSLAVLEIPSSATYTWRQIYRVW